MKKLFKIIFTIFVTFVLNVAQAEQTVPEDIAQVHEAVWKIVHSNGSEETAFFIGPNKVVTHFFSLINLGELNKNHSIDDIHLEQGDRRLKLKRVLNTSFVDGLAILETEEVSEHFITISKEKPSGRLFALLYPEGVKQIQTLIHSEEYEIIDDGHVYYIAVDKANINGVGGAPVLDQKAEMVGAVFTNSDHVLAVNKTSTLEELQEGRIGLDCSKLSLSSCIEQAIKDLTERADNKDPIAQYLASILYFGTRGEKEDLKKAFDWMLQSAENNYAPAQFALAHMYLYGVGVKQDIGQAIKWWLKSANQGYIYSINIAASIYYYGLGGMAQDKEKVSEWMLQLAEQGYTKVQYHLSQMYDKGEGVDQDKTQALYWLSRSKSGNLYPPGSSKHFNGIEWWSESVNSYPSAKEVLDIQVD